MNRRTLIFVPILALTMAVLAPGLARAQGSSDGQTAPAGNAAAGLGCHGGVDSADVLGGGGSRGRRFCGQAPLPRQAFTPPTSVVSVGTRFYKSG